MIGTTLGHYGALERLGEGGPPTLAQPGVCRELRRGEVYAAEDTKLGRQVALKVLPPEIAADPDRLARFQREARAVAALNHPNIVTIYSVEEVDGVQFLTMELVEGQTLAGSIPKGGLALDKLLRVAVPLVEAVAFAHEHGIVHGGLRPSSIMVTDDGRVKVLDFGLATLKPETTSTETTRLATQLTVQQDVTGLAAYMSPEQATGRPVDHRSDIFALGAVLCEMASGLRPFGGDAADSVISSIIRDTPPRPSSMNRAVPPALDRIIARALAKDPAERYESARELRNELQHLQGQTALRRFVPGLVRSLARARSARRMAMLAALVAALATVAWYAVAVGGRGGRRDISAVPRATFAQLTSAPGIEQFPSFTPDGKWVVYAGQESGDWDIYIQSVASDPTAAPEMTGAHATNLTAGSLAEDNEPALSPDGDRIAFRSSRDGGGIFVMERTGESVRRVTPADVADAFNPTWSPDGTEIAYTTEDMQLTPLNWERQSGLWVVNVSTGEKRRLPVADAVKSSWSPHGHRIAYTARPHRYGPGAQPGGTATGTMDLWTIPARGGESVEVTHDSNADWSPTWSPNGRYLYFVSDRGGSMNVWRTAIDEVSGRRLGELEQVTTPAPFSAHPAVSADSEVIAYCAKTETQNIKRVRLGPAGAAEGEPAAVTNGSQAWANPDPTWDGEWVVAYTRDQPEGDLYVIRGDGTGRPRQLTSEPEFGDRIPRWSPDKIWIGFMSQRGNTTGLFKIRFDGSGLQQLAAGGAIAVWSPDGTRLAASARPVGSTGNERVTRLLDPNRSWEQQTPGELSPPDKSLGPFIAQDWSQDGTRLIGQRGFTSGRGDGIVVYTFASRRYDLVSEFGEWPVWLPDSRRVLFVFGGKEYWVVDTLTKKKERIYSASRGVLGPARLTRDGRTAFFPLRLAEADIYLLRFEN